MKTKRWHEWILWPAWVAVAFFAAIFLYIGIAWLLGLVAGIHILGVNPLSVIYSDAFVYGLMLVITLGIPIYVWRIKTSRKELGISRIPTWTDIGLAAAGTVLYILLSVGLIYVARSLFPGFNVAQTQDLGFNNIYGFERLLAFGLFVVVAPLAEELVFRGFLYGKLRANGMPFWQSALLVSLLFGAIHGQWNVGLDVFALSMVASGLRESTGQIWPGLLIHMTKNAVAFYFLFVAVSSLGG